MRLDSIKKTTETNLMDKAYNFQHNELKIVDRFSGSWDLGTGLAHSCLNKSDQKSI